MRLSKALMFLFLAAVVAALGVDGSWGGEASEAPAPEKASSPSQKASGTAGPQNMAPKLTQDSDQQGEAAKESKPPGGKLAKESELRERAQQRWDAVVKKDFTKAYSFETPEYRKENSAETFAQQFGRMVRWHMATVEELRYHRDNEAELVIGLDYSFSLPGSDETVRTTGRFKEIWVLLGDQWWRRSERQPIGGGQSSKPSRQE
jgi:hypothetical protein